MSRYAIWNKTDRVITPIGEVLTPEQWIERYPMGEFLDLVVGGGTINGAYCMEYTSFKDMYEREGCDFSGCVTQQDCLDAIEAFEDERNSTVVYNDQTRIADALEDLVVLNMPDIE
jgi:hypothetical protein